MNCTGVLLAIALGATDGGVAPAERFDSMVDRAVPERLAHVVEQVAQLKSASTDGGSPFVADAVAKADKKFERIAYRSVAAPSGSLNQMQTATAIATATAAVNTSLEGVEAGVSVAPFLLAGKFDWPVQLNVTVAALEKGGARLGLGVARKFVQETLGPAALGLECSPSDLEVKAAFEKHRYAYLVVCEALAGDEAPPDDAQRACGVGDEPTFIEAMTSLSYYAAALAKHTGARTAAALERRDKLLAAAASLKALKLPTIDTCWTDAEVATATDLAAANATTWNAGLSANVDLLPIQWGFAGDSPLSRGEWKSWEGRAELRFASHGYEVGGSLGFTRAREELGKPFYNALVGQLRASAIVASLSADHVRDGGKVQVIDGKVPPHLLVGLLVTTNVALTRHEAQVTPLNKFEVTPYVEAHFGEVLVVRLGIPVRAEVVTRSAVSADDATPERPERPEVRDLQWSVPPTVTTVIKFD